MWFKIIDQQVEIRVTVKPNAKRTAILAVSDQCLHISLNAKPHKGHANKELTIYLAKLLRLPKSQILLRRGEKSQQKSIILPLNEVVQQFLQDPAKFIDKRI